MYPPIEVNEVAARRGRPQQYLKLKPGVPSSAAKKSIPHRSSEESKDSKAFSQNCACELFAEAEVGPTYQPFDLTSEQVFAADGLRFSRDPFDALIVAAALEMKLPLVTRDADIAGAGAVRTVW